MRTAERLLRRRVAPALKAALRRIERAVEIGRIGQRQLAERFAGRGIEDRLGATATAAYGLAVDKHVEGGIAGHIGSFDSLKQRARHSRYSGSRARQCLMDAWSFP